MTPERWHEITALFHAALGQPAASRAQYVEVACKGDDALRTEVNAMLVAHDDRGAAGDVPVLSDVDDAVELVEGTAVGRYTVGATIGAGGMGRVYRGRDARLGRDVAIKVMAAQYGSEAAPLRRFEQEARAASSLTHPNVLTVYDVGTSAGRPYLVTELLDGDTLRARVDRGAMPVERACDTAAAIARGLAAAHANGVVHRDLKPDNVMITLDGRVKILDFGVAKLQASAPDPGRSPGTRPGETAAGVMVGTAGYMAPEQIRGDDVDGRADVFALGALLFELLTGERAFSGASRADLLRATLHDEPRLPSRVADAAPAVARIVYRCLEKDPPARFQSAADLAFALESTPTGGVTPARAARLRPSVALSIIGAAVLVAVTLGVRAVLQRPAVEPRTEGTMARFVLPPPPGTRFAAPATMSPDGRTIVYSATEGSLEGARLFVRRVDQLMSASLPGTEGATTAFFSPDGASIAFWSHGMLRRTRLDAAAQPSIVCPTPMVVGGTWSAENRIVFATAAGGLQVVDASGGTPHALTTIDRSRSEVAHSAPRMLPGGQALLFTVRDADARLRIEVVTVATGARQTVIDDAFDATFISTGHVVYGRRGSLFAVAFDAQALTVSGTPAPLLDRVWTDDRRGSGNYALSDTGTMVFVPSPPPRRRTLAWVDRAGVETALPLEPRAYWTPRISPDGQHVAVVVDESDEARHIWLYHVERGTFSRLSAEGSNWAPVWSRDGTQLYYLSRRDRLWHLIRESVERRAPPAMLLTSADEVVPAGELTDGGSLIYVLRRPAGGGELRRLSIASGDTNALGMASSDPVMPVVSPNGRWLGYTEWAAAPPIPSIFVHPLSGGPGPPRLLAPAAGYTVWNRRGDRLYFASRRGAGSGPAHGVFELPFDAARGIATGPEKQLFRKSFADWLGVPGFDVAGDGRFLVALADESEGPPFDVHVVMDVDDELRRRRP